MNITRIFVLSLFLATAAHAAPPLSLDQATRHIQQDRGVRVLSAERRQRNGRFWYRFKILTPKGRVRQVWIDPRQPLRPR